MNDLNKVFDNLNQYDMDVLRDVKLLVKKYYRYIQSKGNYGDIEVLPSSKFRQIFIAHNLRDEFTVYNSWDFIKDVKEDLLKDYWDAQVYEQEEFIKRANEIF